MFFDSHAHLNDEKFDENRDDTIKVIRDSGVLEFVTVGYSVDSSKKAIEISNKYDFIYSSIGISPNDIPQTEEELWNQIERIREMLNLNPDRLVAIGEIGLDYYWNTENKRRRFPEEYAKLVTDVEHEEADLRNKELQKKAFINQINIANEFDLPIVIHTREAVMDTLDILKQNKVKKLGVFHCCPLNKELVKEALKLGFYISFAGPITFKNSKNADEIINLVPNDKILIETDSPYLSPEPFRGRLNTPINVRYVAQKIAQAKGMNLEEVSKITYENSKKAFEI